MFRSLVVSPSAEERLALKSAVDGTDALQFCGGLKTTTGALEELQSGAEIDMVILSDELGQQDIISFLETAKRTALGRRCCFLLVVQKTAKDNTLMINGLLAGVHAFVTKPISAGKLEESVAIAAGVNGAESKARLKVASGILFAELADEGNDEPRPELSERMKNLATEFHEATGGSLGSCLDEAAERLAPLSPAARVSKTGGEFRASLQRSLGRLRRKRDDE